MQPNLKVSIQDTEAFSKVWTHKGIAVPLLEPHIQFANDYANIVLANFIRIAQQNATAARQRAAEEAAPKVTLE